MTTLAVGLLVIICGLLWLILWRLNDILEYNREGYKTLKQIEKHQLNPRTRIGGKIAPQSGPITKEQQAARLGRASSARRVVVGGDPDSQLNRDLTTSVLRDEEENDE